MFKYKGTEKIITTDDIAVSGNLSNLGNSVSDILSQQNDKLSKLTSNVKWLAIHGGGGSYSTNSTSTNTEVTYTVKVTVDYTDIAGTAKTVYYTLEDNLKELKPLVIKEGSIVKVSVNVTSKMLTTTSYSMSVALSGEKDNPYSEINSYSKSASVSFYANQLKQDITITLIGDQDYSIPVTYYTLIAEENINVGIDGNSSIANNSQIYDSYLDSDIGVYLNLDIKSLVPDNYALTLESLKLNDTNIDFSDKENQLVATYQLKNYFIRSKFGVYRLSLKYAIRSVDDGVISDTPYSEIEHSYTYIYKEPDKIFIYCYRQTDSVEIYDSDETDSYKSTNLRSLPFYYIVYGTSEDSSNARYNIVINGVSQGSIYIQNEILYTGENDYTGDNVYFKPFVFTTNPESITQTYYIPVTEPDAINYIFMDDTKTTMCYNCVGASTSDVGYKTQTDVTFPTINDGLGYFKFTSETNATINVVPTKLTQLTGNNPSNSILNYVKNDGSSKINGTCVSDALYNIGINYQDKSYSNYIFKIYDGKNHDNDIIIYRNKITYPDGDPIEKWAIPADGDYHLISIYIKQWWHKEIVETENWTSSNLQNVYFEIYVDGVLEVAPHSIQDFLVRRDNQIIFNQGDSRYNLIGMYQFNPRVIDINSISKWGDTIKKYVLDFDPIIPSNYYMVYHNEYCSNNTINKTPYDDDMFFDKGIYNNLCTSNSVLGLTNWINYYNYSLSDETTGAHNKFLPIDASVIYNFLPKTGLKTKIPMYRIVPYYSEQNVGDSYKGLNSFLYDTYTAIDEDGDKRKMQCSFLQYVNTGSPSTTGWYDLFDKQYTLQNGTKIDVNFNVQYQGSSTLHYSIKNFEIGLDTFSPDDGSDDLYTIYFNPDEQSDTNTEGLWRFPEQGFNLKADLVDSSSSTNNVIANFVNSYMKSPYDRNGVEYQSCLSGFPILLFMQNNNSLDGKGDDIFLGIYNFNLNRSSVNNLGYLTLGDCDVFEGNVDNATLYIQNKTQASNNTYADGLAVGEISGNSGIYDFTQYDRHTLQKMFGDFFIYNATSKSITEDYNTDFEKICEHFARYVYNNIIKVNGKATFNLWDYNYNLLSDQKNTLQTIYGDDLYYWNGTRNVQISSSTSGKIVLCSDIDENNKPNKELGANGVVYVGNPLYQFHLVTNINGETITNGTNTYYYVDVKDANTFGYSEETHRNNFDLLSAVQYYMVCMAFSMVDSVQKNLNIKRSGNTTWYPEFYDMDTGLGIDNAGQSSNYQAFSDFVDSDGKIIQDYVEPNTEGWFDCPSSMLFLYAKYAKLLNPDTFTLEQATPFRQWCILRGKNAYDLNTYPEYFNKLESADSFCNNYLYPYLGDKIPPIIWNLNYMYKYFSEVDTRGSSMAQGDTEEKRFNGTMKYKRADWLNSRLHYLDALFGIANPRTIGLSTTQISTADVSTFNSDIEICETMFNAFTKGVIGTYSATFNDNPRTPIIFKSSTNTYYLIMTDDNGVGTLNRTIDVSTDCGFYGTKHLTYLSEAGQFMCNSSGGNTILGDLLEKLKITSNKLRSSTITLSNIPSVKEIEIGSLANTLTPMTGPLVIDGSYKSTTGATASTVINNFTLRGVKFEGTDITIKNVSFKNVTFANITCKQLIFDNCTFTNCFNLLTPGGVSANTIKFSNCTFSGVNASGQGLVVSDSYSSVNLTLENCTFYSGSSYTDVYISITNLASLTCTNNSFRNFINLYATILNSVSITSNACAKFILNNYFISSYTSVNNKLSEIVIDNLQGILSSNKNVLLSLGGFTALESLTVNTLNSTDVQLTDGGIARSKLTGLPSSISKLNTSANYAFLDCLDFDYDTLTENFISSAQDLRYAFACSSTIDLNKNNQTLSVKNIINILTYLKNASTNYVDMYYMFLGRSIKDVTILNCIDIANAMPSIDRTYNKNRLYTMGVFYYSSISYYVSEFNTKIGEFRAFIGIDYTYKYSLIESKSLSSFTKITGVRHYLNSLTGDTRLQVGYTTGIYPGHLFINITSRSSGTFLPLSTVSYTTEFTSAQLLEFDVVTSYKITVGSFTGSIVFDFGSTGVGDNLTLYYGLFKYGATTCNILNLINAFKTRYSNITFGSTDFYCSVSRSYTNDDKNNFTDLYNFLVDESSGSPVLREKLLNMARFSLNRTDDSNAFGFNKFITQSNLLTLLELLRNRTTNQEYINGLFRNCTVTNASGDLLKNQLLPFKYFILSFDNFNLLNGSKTIYLDLNEAFCSYSTELNGDEEEIIQLKGNAINLYCAFRNCKLIPFSLFGKSINLGIEDGCVTNMESTFSNTSYSYDSYETHLSLFNSLYFKLLELPGEDRSFPILPENFLSFCSSECNFSNTFYLSVVAAGDASYGSTLKGYLPENLNFWGINGMNLTSTFINCVIFWKYADNLVDIYSNGTSTNDGSTKTEYLKYTLSYDEETGIYSINDSSEKSSIKDYYIFPRWYANLSGTLKFNVIIPMPVNDRVNVNCYIFYLDNNDSIDINIPSYNKLPSIPERNASSSNYYYGLLGMNSTTETDKVPKIIPFNKYNSFPESGDTEYANIISNRMIYVLYCGEADIEIIKNLSSLNKNVIINDTVDNSTEDRKQYYLYGYYYDGSGNVAVNSNVIPKLQ